MKTVASFFSGVGGIDLGLERAGWRVVSHSEIDPYASAVLAERWPGVPNLGDITRIDPDDVPSADLWTGGFPCQDLSVAGKRRGFTGERSVLAFTFLDLVERHRPSALLLENVPGLLTSHGGDDMGRLLHEMADLGYGVAYRTLDARFFGVPQRRRRVFILGLRVPDHDPDGRATALRAAEVLAVGTGSCGHSAKGGKARTGVAGCADGSLELAGNLTRRYGRGVNTTVDDGAVVVSAPSDAPGVRAPDGLARRLDNREELEATVTASAIPASYGHHGHSSPRGDGSDNLVVTAVGFQSTGGSWGVDEGDTSPTLPVGSGLGISSPPAVATFVKTTRPHGPDGLGERWQEESTSPTLNAFDVGEVRAVTLVAPTVNSNKTGGWRFDADQVEGLVLAGPEGEDDLLPAGLDSARYRCAGNGVVAPVAEWIGRRLLEAMS